MWRQTDTRRLALPLSLGSHSSVECQDFSGFVSGDEVRRPLAAGSAAEAVRQQASREAVRAGRCSRYTRPGPNFQKP